MPLGSWQKAVLRDASATPYNPLRALKGKARNYTPVYYQSLKALVAIGALEWAEGPKGGANYVIAGPKLQELLTNS